LKNKVLIVASAVLSVELFMFFVNGSDHYADFIPLIRILTSGRFYLSAYDVFFLISVVIFCVLYRYFSIHPKTLMQQVRGMLSINKLPDLAVIVGAGIVMHMFVNPFLVELFSAPLSDLVNAPDSIRHVVMASLPFWWLMVVGIINKSSLSQPMQSIPANQGIQVPPHWNP